MHIQQTIDYPKMYYVSALDRIKKTNKNRKNPNRSRDMMDDYKMPPDPPVLSKFELMNIHQFSKFSNAEDRTDNLSGDKNASGNDQEYRSHDSMQNQLDQFYTQSKVILRFRYINTTKSPKNKYSRSRAKSKI